MFLSRPLWVCTTMPSATGVVQEAGVPARPSISTRHSRQEPNASIESVAQSLGICVPISMAARMIDVPSGTVTLVPSMVSDTVFVDLEAGVPKSISLISDMDAGSSLGGLQPRRRAPEVVWEVRERAHDGIGREAPQRAQRAEFHGVAEVGDQGEVGLRAVAGEDLVDGLRAACGADAAGRALAAALHRAELEGEAGLPGHIDGFVEHHHAAVA